MLKYEITVEINIIMFGIKIPSLNVLKNPWVLGGLATGIAGYFILTGSNTGFGPLDTGLRDIGNLTGTEGILAVHQNKVPATLTDGPGKTTVVHKTTAPPGFAGYGPPAKLQFSGVGEFGSDDGRLTIA